MTGLTGEKNVIDYGADPTGVADSTTAFNNAFAAGPVVVPFGKYLVSNISVPARGYIRGNAPLGYVGDSPSGTSSKPVLMASAGAGAPIFNMTNAHYATIEGLYLFGNGFGSVGGARGIGSGGNGPTVRDCTIDSFDFGYGDNTSPSGGQLINNQFMGCNCGISGLEDALVLGGAVSSNQNGIYVWAGATNIIGVRVEFNGQNGILVGTGSTGSLVQIIGGLMDANAVCGIQVYQSGGVIINGVMFKRSGVPTNAAGSCHIGINSSVQVIVTGCHTLHTKTDGGSGNDAPSTSVIFAGTNSQIQFVGNYLRGHTTGAWYSGTLPTVDFVNVGNLT